MAKIHKGRTVLYCDYEKCGKEFTRPKSEVNKGKNYCSRTCSMKHRADNKALCTDGYLKVYYENVKVFEYCFTAKSQLKTLLDKVQKDYPGSMALVTFYDENGRK